MESKKLNLLVKSSVLGVMGFLLMFLEFNPIPVFPWFLKFDLGDLPALIGAFSLGPVAGILIELVSNILHGIFKGSTGFVGELANFLVGSAFVFSAGYIYKFKKNKKGAIIALVFGSLVMTIVSAVLNIYVFLPLYAKILGWDINAFIGAAHAANHSVNSLSTYILLAIVPFNIIKAALVSFLTFMLYKRVSKILH
ncbi:MAG: ECF transporter S component [Clostridiaceae bacterium]